MKSKLLVICGPTATGKTKLGIRLAKAFNGEIISADSRQVFKRMDIGTGKEWGEGVKIWGYDLAEPNEEFSVSVYLKKINKVLPDILKREKLPILVGGTGLYIKAIVDGISTVQVPRNDELRSKLESFTPTELFEKLAILDSAKAGSMNYSDKNNPRRLIRAIEVATYNLDHSPKKETPSIRKFNTLFVGLTAPIEVINKNIEKRVEERMDNGFVLEVEELLKKGIGWNYQAMSSLGYREMKDFLKRGVSYEEFIQNWIKNEKNYAKRQITWFKKEKRINWFDITSNNYPNNVEILVNKWHNNLND